MGKETSVDKMLIFKIYFIFYCIELNDEKYKTCPLNSTPNSDISDKASRKKVPNCLSRCHTKRRTDARGCARPSFGMTPTFPKKKEKK